MTSNHHTTDLIVAVPEFADESAPDSMAEATRLTREGRLSEATAMIQRVLSGREPQGRASRDAVDDVPHGGRGSLAWLKDLPGTISQHVPKAPSGMPDVNGLPGLDGRTGLPGLNGLSGLGGLPGMSGLGAAAAPVAHGMSRRTFRAPAGERPYLLHVPDSLPAGPVPLVMMLHGGTQDGATFADATGMNDLADEHGFIVVYPEQVTSANPMRYWNWFSPADQRRGQGEASILAGLVEEVARHHTIDSTQVFVAGFSAGAAMAAVLGDQYADVFSAIGVHSGVASGAAGDMISAFAAMRRAPASRPARQPVRAIIFHGSEDSTVDVSNARALAEQFCAATGEMTTIEGREHKAYTRTVVGTELTPDCEVWVVRGAGHVWCGGRPGGSYADAQAPDASGEMVRFFLAGRTLPVAEAA